MGESAHDKKILSAPRMEGHCLVETFLFSAKLNWIECIFHKTFIAQKKGPVMMIMMQASPALVSLTRLLQFETATY
jgi:hypothetical protein